MPGLRFQDRLGRSDLGMAGNPIVPEIVATEALQARLLSALAPRSPPLSVLRDRKGERRHGGM